MKKARAFQPGHRTE